MKAWRPTLALLALVWGSNPALAEAPGLKAARQLAAEGRRSEALDGLESILAQDPDHLEALLLKGVLWAELGHSAEAETLFLELTELRPDLPEPYNNLAAMYGAAGKYEQAVALLKLALRTHPSYGTVYENLTKIYGKLASQAYDRALGRESAPSEEPVELVLLSELERRAPREPEDLDGTDSDPKRLGWSRCRPL